MAYRRARSLQALYNQINDAFPNRDRASDGWIGDTSHQARKSDHNPDSNGVVHAIDVDEDNEVGDQVIGRLLWQYIQEEKPDWFKYGIYEADVDDYGGIMSSYNHSGGPAWEPRSYSGWNPHNKHVHISAKDDRPFSGTPFNQWVKDKTVAEDNWIDENFPEWITDDTAEREMVKAIFTKHSNPNQKFGDLSLLRAMIFFVRAVRYALRR